jgi:integrase
MSKPMSPAFLRNLKLPAQGQTEHTDGGSGLRLRCATTRATWILGCRDAQGRARRFSLGTFPAMGLKDARIAAHRLRERVRDGYDPIAAARTRRAEEKSDTKQITLGEVLDAYGDLVGSRRRSWRRARQLVEHVFRAKLSRRAIELTAPELQLVVDRHDSRASAGAAVRILKPVAKWAARRALMGAGIAEALELPEGARRARDRVLSRDEIRAILTVLDSFPGHGDCLRWLFLTGARLDEACSSRWGDVADGVWNIKATKQGREHAVPLPAQALAFLREQVRGEADDLVFTNSVGHKLSHWDRVTKQIYKLSGTTGWHRHDIRRTAATFMGELGVAPHIIEVCLGHTLRTSSDGSTVGRIAATYNRSRYRAEHADALQRLADELDRIGEDTNIIRLRA